MIIGKKDGVHVCSVVVVGMMFWQDEGDMVCRGGIEGKLAHMTVSSVVKHLQNLNKTSNWDECK